MPRSRSSPVPSWSCRSAMRATRSMPPMPAGAVSTMPSMAPMSIEETGTLARGASYNPVARPRGDRARARVAGSGRAAVVRQSSERNRLRDCGRRSAGHADRWHADHARQAAAVQRIPGCGSITDRTVVRESWSAHRGAHRSRASDRPRRPGWRCGRPARIGPDHDHGSRGLHRGGRQRGQGGRVSQLARA